MSRQFHFWGKYKDLLEAYVEVAYGSKISHEEIYETEQEAINATKTLCNFRTRHSDNGNIQSVVIARRKNKILLARMGC